MKALHKQGLYLAAASFQQNLSLNAANDFLLNEQGLVGNVLNGLNGQYITASANDIATLANSFGTRNLSIRPTSGVQSANDIDMSGICSKAQQSLARPFIDSLLAANDFEEAAALALDFQDEIASSSLTREDQLILFSLSASVQALSEFMAEGGDAQFKSALNRSKSGSAARCAVNMRSVIISGVTGFFGGGATGAYAGCTGGTVALPGLGTVAGCVSGAVFGAAGGFLAGVAYGIAGELIGTCGR